MPVIAAWKWPPSGLQNYRLQVGDAYELDFPDDSFDVLVNNYMFDLLPERDFSRVLGEFGREAVTGARGVRLPTGDPGND